MQDESSFNYKPSTAWLGLFPHHSSWDRCLVPVNTLSLKIELSAWFTLKRLSTVGFTSTNRPSFGRKLNYLTKACMTQARLCGDTSNNF